MNRREAHPALAAVAGLTSLLGLTTLVATTTWFARAIWLVVLAIGAGVLVRRFWTRSAVAVVPSQIVVTLLAVVWMYAGSSTWYGLPTLATVRRFGALFAEFGTTAVNTSAPMPANTGVEVTLALIGTAVVLLVDILAVTRGAPAAAGLPMLTAFLAAAANSGAALHPFYFLAAALAWLVLLAQHAQQGMRRWASVAVRPMEPIAIGASRATSELRFAGLARRLGAVGLIAAVALPAVLPHLPTRYLLDGLARSADGRGNAKVGFSSTLDVGTSLNAGGSGRILTYRSTAPSPTPLRVLAATAYDGTSWSRPNPTLGRSARLDLSPEVARSERTIVVENNSLEPPALATPQPITTADLNAVGWQVDESTSDVYVQARPASYSTTYLEPIYTPDLLRNGVDGSPGPDRLPTGRAITAALEVDPRSAAAIRDATNAVTTQSQSPYDKAVAIQDWLRGKGGFTYSLTLTTPDSSNGARPDPISAFLQTKRGYCVQFASTMAMMARATGIPARVAIGFLPGSQQDGVWTVTSADAHAWPELFFPGAGWVRFEPTPSVRTGNAPAWTLPAITPAPLPTSTARLTDDPASRDRDRPDRETPSEQTTTLDVPVLDRVLGWVLQVPHLLGLVVLLVVLAALVLPVTAAVLRRVRAGRPGPPARIAEAHWQTFTGRLDDLGVTPVAGGTLRDAQAHYARAGFLGETGTQSLATVVDTVERARYARPGAFVDPHLEPLTRVVLHEVARTRSWQHRIRATMLPTDARRWWRALGRRLGARPRAWWGRRR